MTYAAAWERWFTLIESAAAPLSRRMLALASVGKGHRVLDIGTGIGEPAMTAAIAVGPGGGVFAIDPDPDMIAIARKRAELERLSNIELAVQRVEELRLPQASFDAVLCRWSLMFVDDFDATLAGLRGLLRPGGRLVAATWGPPDRAPALSLARGAIHGYFGVEPPRYGPKTAFALSDTDRLVDAFRSAGFVETAQERLLLTYRFRSVEEYLRFRTDCTGDLFSDVGDITDAARRQALDAVTAALEEFRSPDGSFSLENDAYLTAGSAADAKSGTGADLRGASRNAK